MRKGPESAPWGTKDQKRKHFWEWSHSRWQTSAGGMAGPTLSSVFEAWMRSKEVEIQLAFKTATGSDSLIQSPNNIKDEMVIACLSVVSPPPLDPTGCWDVWFVRPNLKTIIDSPFNVLGHEGRRKPENTVTTVGQSLACEDGRDLRIINVGCAEGAWKEEGARKECDGINLRARRTFSPEIEVGKCWGWEQI